MSSFFYDRYSKIFLEIYKYAYNSGVFNYAARNQRPTRSAVHADKR